MVINKLKIIFVVSVLFLTASFTVQANSLASCQDLAVFGNVNIIDFEDQATITGNEGAVTLIGDEFPGLSLTSTSPANLWVGIPDTGLSTTDNCINFYANDFFAVSGVAVFSPDNCINPGSPIGEVMVNFDSPVIAVGLYFLDAEGAVSSITAFDGLDGTGSVLGVSTAQGLPDNSQAFRYVGSPSGGIQSAIIQLGGGGDGVGMDDLCFVDSIPVDIDIKPGSDPNCFNINGHGVVPVAILGSDAFDVTTIDIGTVVFAGLEVRVRGKRGPLCSYEDSNGDGYTDLVCHYEDDAAMWSPGSADACVEGSLLEAFGGLPFRGCDSICVVP